MATAKRQLSFNRRKDPTQTTTIRKKYAQKLRGWFGKLNAEIRNGIQSRNVFAINEQDPTPPGVYAFPRDDRKVDAFMGWLRQQERKGVLDIISKDQNRYIRMAYESGLEHANYYLEQEGVDIGDADVQNIFNLPVHQDAVQFLYTRNFNELQGITDVMNQQISRELAEGFAAGKNPTTIARDITDRVSKIGKTRSTVLARTEVIRAHSEATLNQFERFDDVEGIRVRAEWSTAGDSRVCPVCQTLEGRTWSIEEVRSDTFTFQSQDFPVRPPTHPQCRCALLPVGKEPMKYADKHDINWDNTRSVDYHADSDTELEVAEPVLNDTETQKLMRAINKEADLPPADSQKVRGMLQSWKRDRDGSQADELAHLFDDLEDREPENAVESWFAEVKSASREFFRHHYGDEKTVYRGVCDDTAETIREGIDSNDLTLIQKVAENYSHSRKQAARFGPVLEEQRAVDDVYMLTDQLFQIDPRNVGELEVVMSGGRRELKEEALENLDIE